MIGFATVRLPALPDATAPDGSQVRLLGRIEGASVAQFRLEAGATSRAVMHRTVAECWVVTDGHGQLWRSLGGQSALEELKVGVCVTLPVGTAFQFRAAADCALAVIGVTAPAWPGDHEALPADGPWQPTV